MMNRPLSINLCEKQCQIAEDLMKEVIILSLGKRNVRSCRKTNDGWSYKYSLVQKRLAQRISRPQDFEAIRQQCLDNGELFTDPEFPPDGQSIFYSKGTVNTKHIPHHQHTPIYFGFSFRLLRKQNK